MLVRGASERGRDGGRWSASERTRMISGTSGCSMLDDELSRMVAAGLPGAFVHVDDGAVMKFLTAGVADLSSGRVMTPDSHYRIGSTTKTFTAVVILQLVDEGRIDLSDRVASRLPDLEIPGGDTLTVEHLLRMRSGLFDFVDDPGLLSLDANLTPYTLEESLRLGLAREPTFRPGERFQYCNTNFCLLEALIERVTGRSLGAELFTRIFEPLAMNSTVYPPEDDLSLPDPFIRGYDWAGTGWRECSNVFFGRGDGGVISTAVDVARFLRGLLGGRLIPAALLARMQTVVPDHPPPEFTYGLGLMADELGCGTVWGHSGGGFGYRHLPFIHPESGRVVISMLNGTYGFRVSSIVPEDQPRFTPEMRSRAYSLAWMEG